MKQALRFVNRGFAEVHLNGHRGEVNTLRAMMGFPPALANQGG